MLISANKMNGLHLSTFVVTEFVLDVGTDLGLTMTGGGEDNFDHIGWLCKR